MRQDRSTAGNISLQKVAPDAALVTLSDEKTSLSSYIASLTPKL